MPRRGKERERRGAFREGAVDPAMGGFYGEEAEEAPFSPSGFPDDFQLEWIRQNTHMEGYPPVDNVSGA